MRRMIGLLTWSLLSSVPVAQELLWERTGERERNMISGWAVPFGDVDRDGVEDWIAQAVRFIDLGIGADRQVELWVLSGVDGRTLRVRGRYRPTHAYDVFCGAGDMDGDGIGDYAFTVFDIRNPPTAHVVEVCSGRDDSLIWRQTKATPSRFGSHLLGGRDLNGDGEPDLLVTDGSYQPQGAQWPQGSVYAYSSRGQLLWFATGNAQMGIAQFGAHSSSIGWVGDVNGDGVDDFVVGGVDDVAVRGMAAVMSGRDGTILVRGLCLRQGEELGHSVDGCGDQDGDGIPDFVASSTGGGADRGYLQVFSGRTGETLRLLVERGHGVSLRSGSQDFDLDGIADIATTHWLNPVATVRMYSGRDTEVMHRITECPSARCTPTGIGTAMAVGRPQPGNPFPLLGVGERDYFNYGVPRWQTSLTLGRLRVYRGAPVGVTPIETACSGSLARSPRMGIRHANFLLHAERPGLTRVHLSDAPSGAPAALLLGHGAYERPWLFGCSTSLSVDALIPAVTGTSGINRGYAWVDLPRALAVPGQHQVVVQGRWVVLDPMATSLGGLTNSLQWLH